jgi:hypothetical protein
MLEKEREGEEYKRKEEIDGKRCGMEGEIGNGVVRACREGS